MEQNSLVRGQFINSCVSDVVDSIFNMLLKMQKCSQNSCSLGDERKLRHSILEDQTTPSKKESKIERKKEQKKEKGRKQNSYTCAIQLNFRMKL
jgi:hypothetical protein